MVTVRFGGKKGAVVRLKESPRHIVIRTQQKDRVARTPLSAPARAVVSQFRSEIVFRRAGVEILATPVERGAKGLRDRARQLLKRERTIRFAGRLLVDARSGDPVAYTENLFVKFYDDVGRAACRRLLARHGLTIKRELAIARNSYFVGAREGVGQRVFAIAEKVLGEASVELCHPELARAVRRRGVFSGQWHLKRMSIGGRVIDAHANVEAAWAMSTGAGITVAVIDDGVDIAHEEFAQAGKVVAPRDVTMGIDDPRPGPGDDHGTACAGVAVASGRFGASGVAPDARLMPIRCASPLGSIQEADAFEWAADHGADVISCSWGPQDGDWSDPSDPMHQTNVPLPDSTRLAIEYALTHGRNGKGCVITWAAGNGNESVDLDGYASHPGIIAVAACNDSSKKSAYSDFGNAVWCAFPSNDTVQARTPGIFTTDRRGKLGYNIGLDELGDKDGDYTNDFGGTSSACPGVAGVAALVLARNPDLRHDEVRDILRRACDRIDVAHGGYDASGHSPLYGYGRIDARLAVELARPANPGNVAIRATVRDVSIPDLGRASLVVAVADVKSLTGIRVSVDLEHTYVGDLIVTLRPPTASGVPAIVLHDRAGGGTRNLKRTYDVVSTPALAQLVGASPAGNWTLVVDDKERADSGTLRSVTLELHL